MNDECACSILYTCVAVDIDSVGHVTRQLRCANCGALLDEVAESGSTPSVDRDPRFSIPDPS